MKKGINKLKRGAFLSERDSKYVILYKILRAPSLVDGDMVRVEKFFQYYDTPRAEKGSSIRSISSLLLERVKISHINEIFKHKILILNYSSFNFKTKNISKVYR